MDVMNQSGYEWIKEDIERSRSCDSRARKSAIQKLLPAIRNRNTGAPPVVCGRAAVVMRAIAEDYSDFAPVITIRLRAAGYKLLSAVARRRPSAITIRRLMSDHRIWTLAAVFVITLILFAAPADPASQPVVRTSGTYTAATENMPGTAEIPMRSEELSYDATIYEYLRDEATPLADWKTAVELSAKDRVYPAAITGHSTDAQYPRTINNDTPNAENSASILSYALDRVPEEAPIKAIAQTLKALELSPAGLSGDHEGSEGSDTLTTVEEAFIIEPDDVYTFEYPETTAVLSSATHDADHSAQTMFVDEESDYAGMNGTVGVEITEADPLTASTGAYIWPTAGHLTSLYGRRITSVGSSMHKGIDICGSYGQSIYAADGGEIIVSGWSNSYGYVVQIMHDNGDVTLYCHCRALLVSVGERVSQGQEIALMGNTGLATGTHLHFEIIIGGENVDPLPHLPQNMEEWGVWC